VIPAGRSPRCAAAGQCRPAGLSRRPARAPLQDRDGHGTHCAGSVAASNNAGVGVVGVAPGTRVVAVKVRGLCCRRWAGAAALDRGRSSSCAARKGCRAAGLVW
jgi:hypothetical protein